MHPSMSVPVGFRFNPTDVELISYYLYNRLFNSENFKGCYIKEIDLYGDVEPWDVWKKHIGDRNDAALYCFTALKKKVAKASTSRINRTVATGTWAGENAATRIEIPNSEVVGLKKKFRYEKEGSRDDGGWFMDEYSISGYNNIVVCCLRPNNRKCKKRTRGYGDEGDEDMSKRKRTGLVVDSCPNQVNNCPNLSTLTSCSGSELLAPGESCCFQRLDSGLNCCPGKPLTLLACQENASQQLDSGFDFSEVKPFSSDLETQSLAHQETTYQPMQIPEPVGEDNFQNSDDLLDTSVIFDSNFEVSAPFCDQHMLYIDDLEDWLDTVLANPSEQNGDFNPETAEASQPTNTVESVKL